MSGALTGMTKSMRVLLSATAVVLGLMSAAPAFAEDGAQIEKQNWSFSGAFGTYDRDQLQRGFQVFKEVCSGCHSAQLLSFRNLSEKGGPEYSEAQVKALAATYQVTDAEAEGGKRPGIPADAWPTPDQSPADLQAAFGVVPPDLSVMAKARGVPTPFPWWIIDYITPYQEGGPDYIHALLTSFGHEPPAGVEVPDGKYYNPVFPGGFISMPPPLTDGQVTYDKPENGAPVPETVDQYSRDVSAFLMWVADPHLVDRKEAGMGVILFLVLFAGLMFAVKRKLWSNVEH